VPPLFGQVQKLIPSLSPIATLPEPPHGSEHHDLSLASLPAQYRFEVTSEEFNLPLSDREIATLRRPTYAAIGPGYSPFYPETTFSPRVAPQMIGLGFREATSLEYILVQADPEDANSDGISGRSNIVWLLRHNQPMFGRFRLKAGAPTARQQSAGAFEGEIGNCNLLFPAVCGECTAQQTDCISAPMVKMTNAGLRLIWSDCIWSPPIPRTLGIRPAAMRETRKS
jgi:CxxC motif-containing protein (DUF1111 family)